MFTLRNRPRQKINFYSLAWKRQLERTVDGAPSQIPTLKFLTPNQVPPLRHDPCHIMKILVDLGYVSCVLFVRTQSLVSKSLKLTL